jgi:2-phosphosulfolactate phosphatase
MGCGRDRLPPKGFDYGNSPAALMGCDFGGRRIILYTPNGTRGIIRSKGARALLAGSFVCAQATAEYIKRLSPNDVTFVITGPEGEDQDCAEYIAELISDQVPDISALLAELRNVWLERFRTDVAAGRITEKMAAGFEADLACCTSLNRFDFAMVVRKQEELLVMEAAY